MEYVSPEYPETFCPLPWVHQATLTDGSLLPCCVADNQSRLNLKATSFKSSFHSAFWNNLRRQMLNGEKPSPCSRCWVEEKNGYSSHRMMEIDAWEARVGRDKLLDMIAMTDPDGSIELQPVSLDLRLGNTCNLQCVMCRPHESVKWTALSRKIHDDTKREDLKGDMKYKLSVDPDGFTWQENEALWEELKQILPTLSEIIVGGGEPMLLKGHFDFIRHCVESGYAKYINLRYHTNLTVLDRSLFDLWRKFKKVEFFVSLDGVGEVNAYVRHPTNFHAVEANLDFLESLPDPNIKIMLLFSAHCLSLYHLDDFARWVQDKKFQKVTHGFSGYYHPGIVMFPAYMSPQILPAEIKNEITERVLAFERSCPKPSNKIEGVLQFMNACDQSRLLPTTLEYLRQLDRHRGTDFTSTFPELARKLGY